jgi:CHCH domain
MPLDDLSTSSSLSSSSNDHRASNTITSLSSKFQTDCSKEHAASLSCIVDNLADKKVCQPFFEAYKACRKEENKRRLEANAKKYLW